MADRSNFWKMVDRTKPSKLRVFGESELRDCQDYFLEIQSDSTLPPKEIITASQRLTLIRSEIDLRRGDAEHRRTQRLARWAIGAAGRALSQNCRNLPQNVAGLSQLSVSVATQTAVLP